MNLLCSSSVHLPRTLPHFEGFFSSFGGFAGGPGLTVCTGSAKGGCHEMSAGNIIISGSIPTCLVTCISFVSGSLLTLNSVYNHLINN